MTNGNGESDKVMNYMVVSRLSRFTGAESLKGVKHNYYSRMGSKGQFKKMDVDDVPEMLRDITAFHDRFCTSYSIGLNKDKIVTYRRNDTLETSILSR